MQVDIRPSSPLRPCCGCLHAGTAYLQRYRCTTDGAGAQHVTAGRSLGLVVRRLSALASMADTEEPTSQQVVIKWHGTEFSVTLADDDTVGSLKHKIEAETEVAPKRQKLLGLKAKKGGGVPADTVHVSELLLKPGMKVMMMGCAEVQQMSDHAS